MKLGIMQPYFVPYIGYWQLMNAVDQYVVYDDVNFIKGGWINRNQILINGEPSFFNIPMKGASSYKKINEIKVDFNKREQKKSIIKIENAYRKAPYFENIQPLVKEIISCESNILSEFIYNSFLIINRYLGIETKLIVSSSLEKDNTLHGQDKVLHICKLMKASTYYNAIGGQKLYSYNDFSQNNIKLCFLKTNPITYCQYKQNFVPNLSILDVMMFNTKEEIQKYLTMFELVEG